MVTVPSSGSGPVTIPVTPQTHLEVSRKGEYTRLSLVSVRAGARVATDMPPAVVEALVSALAKGGER